MLNKFRFAPTVLALAVSAAVSLPVMADDHAAEDNGSYYNNFIHFGGYYLVPDQDRTLTGNQSDSFGYTASFGHRLSDNLWVEGEYFGATIETGNGNGTDYYQQGFGANLQYAFGQRSEFTPYVLAGLGGVNNDVLGSDNFGPYLNIGAGFTKAVLGFEGLRLRGEARVVYDDFDNNTNSTSGNLDFRIGAGIEMALGKPREVIKEVPVEVEKVVVQEVPVERVVIKEVPVEAPMDDDGDGVINSADQCPNTPAGAKVDGNGCVVQQTIVMRDITFEFDSARLTTNAQRLMESTVAFLRSDESARVVIAGHTDSRGDDSYNQKLSRQRANEVRDYLIGYGIDGSRLQAVGFGESQPVASNDTDDGREQNRRVEFRIEK